MSPETDQKLAEALDYLRMPEVTKGKYAVVPVKGDRAAVAVIEAAIADMRSENARLLIAFHDAIRRPLGVTPDSGAEFYHPRMADEAEARRASRVVLRELDPEEAAARAAALADARRREKRGGGSAA